MFNIPNPVAKLRDKANDFLDRRRPRYDISVWGYVLYREDYGTLVPRTILAQSRITSDFLPRVGDNLNVIINDLEPHYAKNFDSNLWSISTQVYQVDHNNRGGVTVWVQSDDFWVQDDDRKFRWVSGLQERREWTKAYVEKAIDSGTFPHRHHDAMVADTEKEKIS